MIPTIQDINREHARRKLLEFTLFTFPEYQVNWHHRLICEKLDKFVEGEIKNLMLFVPPQHGKSELASRRLPAFFLGRNPHRRVILSSYSSTIAQNFSRSVQGIIDSDEYRQLFPNTILPYSRFVTRDMRRKNKDKIRTAKKFEIMNDKGALIAVGVGGSLTSESGDIAIIDDPVKDWEQAISKRYRERAWNWFESVLSTRLDNEGQKLIIQTRWNKDDLSGRVLESLKKEGVEEQWEVISLPAIKEGQPTENDPRKRGEALWENKHSAKKHLQVKSRNSKIYYSLLQQKPTTDEGQIFAKESFPIISYSEFMRIAREQNDKLRVRFVEDTAYTDDEGNDPTGIAAYFRIGGRAYIVDYEERYVEFPKLVEFTEEFVSKNGGENGSLLQVENKASGKSLVQTLNSFELSYQVKEFKNLQGSKIERAKIASLRTDRGDVVLVRGKWMDKFLEDIKEFPDAINDEAVDCLVMIVNDLPLARKGRKQNFKSIGNYIPDRYDGLLD